MVINLKNYNELFNEESNVKVICSFLKDNKEYQIIKTNKDFKYLDYVCDLWRSIFCDESYSSYFYKNYICDIYLCITDNKVVALANSILSDTLNYKARYLYALCTDINYRKKGLMSYMLKKMDEDFINNKIDFSFLLPENSGLYPFYLKNGYKLQSLSKKTTYKIGESNLKVEELNDKKHLINLYNNLSNLSLIKRDDKVWDRIVDNSYKIFYTLNSYAIVYYEDDKYIIEEMVVNDNKEEFVFSIMNSLGVEIIDAYEVFGENDVLGFVKCYSIVKNLKRFYNFLR